MKHYHYIIPEIMYDYLAKSRITLKEIKDNLAMSADEFIEALSFRYEPGMPEELCKKSEENLELIESVCTFITDRRNK